MLDIFFYSSYWGLHLKLFSWFSLCLLVLGQAFCYKCACVCLIFFPSSFFWKRKLFWAHHSIPTRCRAKRIPTFLFLMWGFAWRLQSLKYFEVQRSKSLDWGGVADIYYKGGVSSFCLMSWPCGELGPDVVFLSFLFQHDFNINVQASINNCIKKTCSSSFIVQSWCIITDTVPLAKKLTNLRFRSKTHRGKMWRSHWITSQFGLLQFFNVVCSSLVTQISCCIVILL